jgi:hypothetical protein
MRLEGAHHRATKELERKQEEVFGTQPLGLAHEPAQEENPAETGQTELSFRCL